MDGNIPSKCAKVLLLLLMAVAAAGIVLYLTRQQPPLPAPVPPVTIAKIQPLPDPFRAVISAADAADRTQAILRLRQWISSRSKEEAVGAIRRFLASGQDAPTGQGFKINSDGSLRQAPTARTLLLDTLGQLDPPQAAAAALEILQQKGSPDEWAVAMALCARANADPASLAFLQQKVEEMATYQPWQQNPSVGFLEAFNVFVYTDDTEFVPQLSQFASNQENPGLAHAAFLTLDRLVQIDPVDTLGTLQDDPSLLSGRAAAEGNLFARADLRDPGQAALLADYLLSPDRTPTELTAFAGVFPNENFMISDNLLTPSPPLSNAEVLARYQAAQQTVNQWLQDTRFSNLWPQFQQIQARLDRILPPQSRPPPE